MSATLLPSNLVTPNADFAKNPDWTPNETAVPQANILTEDGNGRLLIVVGKCPKVVSSDIPLTGLAYTSAFGEGIYTEEAAIFRFQNLCIQNTTSFQLENVGLFIPGSGVPPASRNLTNSLCGDLVSNDFVTPRRFVLRDVDTSIPIVVNQTPYVFDISSILPNGRNIQYFSLADALGYLVTALTNFMKNQLGDSTFYASIYVDKIGPRLFYTSTTYGLNSIRLIIGELENRQPNFLNILFNHMIITDLRVGDTSQSGLGYATGESIGFQSRSQTGFQNNSTLLTLHSNELTQFRKGDSIAPTDGTSLVGVVFPYGSLGNTSTDPGQYQASLKGGFLNSPKVSFDRTQTLTEFMVTLRVLQGTGNAVVMLKPTELQNSLCILTFRMW